MNSKIDQQLAPLSRRRIVLVITAVVTVSIDIASKIWATDNLANHGKRIGSITLRLVHNHGVVFGLAGYLPPSAIIALTASISVMVAFFAWRGTMRPPFAAGLIVGGAFANVADRLTAGSVVDFISVGRGPIFNLADIFLIAGIVLLTL